MYVFNLKRGRRRPVPIEIENIMDRLISEPYVILPDHMSFKLGKYTNELRNNGLLHLSTDTRLGEPIAILKINNYVRPNAVKKKKGFTIQYIFEDTFIPRFNIPKV